MPHRLQHEKAFSGQSVLRQPVVLFSAVRRAMAHGYTLQSLRHDLLSGAVVGVIAIPLSMALAIAVGVSPQHGLYTAIVAGFITALFGGSRYQVTGPTAAFVVILVPVVNAHGLNGLLVATVLAGVILIAMGVARLGRLIEFVPYPVVSGFTAGIAVVLATLQLRDFLGLEIDHMPDAFPEKVGALLRALPTTTGAEFAIGAGTLILLLCVPRVFTKVPGPLLVLPVAAIAAFVLEKSIHGLDIATINDRFHYAMGGADRPGIPQLPPIFALPWASGEGPSLSLSLGLIRELLPTAFTIAVLASIESLLSAVVADGMTGGKHNPDNELVALGLGNIVAPFFGGFAATGALARTAANIRFGARSPLSAMTHALVILAAILAAAPLLGYLPMASLAALLMVVAWNMSEAKHFVHLARIAPRSDVFVLLGCFSLTVIFDMVIAVGAGLILASVLFIRRMAEVGTVKLVSTEDVEYPGLPHDVLIYEIAGPLFFGAAERAMSRINLVAQGIKTVVFDFRNVPAMDVTGLLNFQSAVGKLQGNGVSVVMGGVVGQPRKVLQKAGWNGETNGVRVYASFEDALRAVFPEYGKDDGDAWHEYGRIGTDVY